VVTKEKIYKYSKGREIMDLERVIVQENEFPVRMTRELIQRWAGIPRYSENDPKEPEWQPTPTTQLPGFENVYVKDESFRASNPTGTIKDRPAWEIAALYRDFARVLELRGNFLDEKVPRISYVTAGNVGRSVSEVARKFGLPPMKLLVDSFIPTSRLAELKKLHADIYMVDLKKKELSSAEIKALTNNQDGVDLTSVVVIEPQRTFYDWHVHEAFNENPGEVYVPYGSGRLFENYLTWQEINSRVRDPRLKAPILSLLNMSILGARPKTNGSVADKLVTDYNPFRILKEEDFSSMHSLSFTGDNTGVYKVSDDMINQAHKVLTETGFETEHSGSAGLALYLQRLDEGKINPRKKVLIINTGRGI
jgi:threonine synthase